MAWCLFGTKPLYEQKFTMFYDTIPDSKDTRIDVD